jgi:ribosomal protein L32
MFDNRKVSKEIQQQRLAVCKTCEHNLLNVCKKCGCVLKLKTQWKTTRCPVNNWGPVD